MALVYWSPATYFLFKKMEGADFDLPTWLEYLFLPVQFLGLLLGFTKGKTFMLLGQLIMLVVVFVLFRMFTSYFEKKD